MKRALIVLAFALASASASANVPVKCVTAANRVKSCINPKAVTVDSTGKLRAAKLYMGADDITETTLRLVVQCSGTTPVLVWGRDAKGVNFAGSDPGTMTSDTRALATEVCSVVKPKLDPKLKP